jgi:protein gp37
MLGPVDLEKYLNDNINEVACSGESGMNVRPLNYDWVLDVRRQCISKNVPFQFHQTGAYFIKDGKMYHIPRHFQISQARKAGIDYKIKDGFIPDV